MLQLDSRQVRAVTLSPTLFSIPILTRNHKLRICTSFDSSIEIFSVHHSGTGIHILTSNKKIKDGMKGIPSSTTFSPPWTVYAAGSLSSSLGSIVVYAVETDEEQEAVGGGVTRVCTLVLRS